MMGMFAGANSTEEFEAIVLELYGHELDKLGDMNLNPVWQRVLDEIRLSDRKIYHQRSFPAYPACV